MKQNLFALLSALLLAPSAFAIAPSHEMPFQCAAVIQEASAHLKWKAGFADLVTNPPLQTGDRVVDYQMLFHEGLDRVHKLQSLGALRGGYAATADAEDFFKRYRKGILSDSYSITTMRAQVTLFESLIDQALDQSQRQHGDCQISHVDATAVSGARPVSN